MAEAHKISKMNTQYMMSDAPSLVTVPFTCI